jgi:hypothetical protein
MSLIFISHSSLDVEQSLRLLSWLQQQGFVSTFLDFDKHLGIDPGADWERTLYKELSAADAVILILTQNWFAIGSVYLHAVKAGQLCVLGSLAESLDDARNL